MNKKVCKCGHGFDMHGYKGGRCFVKECACEAFKKQPKSDSPSPEMVCPTRFTTSSRLHKYGWNSIWTWSSSPNCKTFGASLPTIATDVHILVDDCSNIPSLEPPEKVSQKLLLTDTEMSDLPIDPYASWVYQMLNAQILKLQQAGWGNLTELKSELESCVNTLKQRDNQLETAQARIKELEADIKEWKSIANARDKMVDVAKAEARQQAFQSVENIVNPYKADQSVNLPEYCTAVGFNKAINAVKKILKQGELPKEQ
jgi:hypothetical protein